MAVGADAAFQQETQVVCLEAALPAEPEVGTPDLPTAGSRGHRLGVCKPCAFLHTKGCTNGKECAFCHLCSRGEKKRRQREVWQQQQVQKQQLVQQTRQQRQQQSQQPQQQPQQEQPSPPQQPSP